MVSLNRRIFLKISTAALEVPCFGIVSGADEPAWPTQTIGPFVEVEIESGRIRGGHTRGALAFKGIPYAGSLSMRLPVEGAHPGYKLDAARWPCGRHFPGLRQFRDSRLAGRRSWPEGISSAMSGYWASFARSGVPSANAGCYRQLKIRIKARPPSVNMTRSGSSAIARNSLPATVVTD